MKLAPTFVCQDCSFSFQPKSGRTTPPHVCPNCGREGTMIVRPDADTLLKDIDNIF